MQEDVELNKTEETKSILKIEKLFFIPSRRSNHDVLEKFKINCLETSYLLHKHESRALG